MATGSTGCDCSPGHSCAERDRIRATMNRRFADWEKSQTTEKWDAYQDAYREMVDHLYAAADRLTAERRAADGTNN